jgi:hypothetical protein
MVCLHLLVVSSQESTASLVVHSLALAVCSLVFLVARLLHLLPEQELSFPMSLALLAIFSQVSVPPLQVLSVVLPVPFQVLSVVQFLESTTSLAESSLVLEVSCPTLSVLPVLFQPQSVELSRTLAQLLAALLLELEVFSLVQLVESLDPCLPLLAVLFLVLATQQAELSLVPQPLSQVLLVALVERLVVFSVVFWEAVPCHRPSPAHPAQFLESSSVLPMEPSPLAQISSVFKHLFLGSWA